MQTASSWMTDPRSMSLGLYIHIPYCRKKCGYCGFVSYPLSCRYVPDAFLETALQEMQLYSTRYGKRRVDTVFIGGGTPSLLSPEQILKLMKGIKTCFEVAEDAEITCEANPDSLTGVVLSSMIRSGINRLSIGAQSMDDTILRKLGRIHDRDAFCRAYERAKEAGFSNINVDLMFGLPGQTYEQWLATLREVMALDPAHLSLYTLQIEENTPFYHAYKEGRIDLPALEDDRRMYHDACRFLREAGWEHYEISNFAVPSKQCRHNMKYWTMASFIGIGPSAASYYEGKRYQNPASVEQWRSMIGNDRLMYDDTEPETTEDAMEIFCFTALRTSAGLDFNKFRERFGVGLEDAYKDDPLPVGEWVSKGLARYDSDRLILTETGINISNDIMSAFMR